MNIENFIQSRVDSENISCKSFVVTVFGDLVSQHGGWIWLGSLIQCLQPLGYSERLIRTSVYRLVQEDWLQVKKLGRKSYYSFTANANRHYTKAARRIYANQVYFSNRNWLIVLPVFVPDDKMPLLKRQLRWLGFSPLVSGAYAHPSSDQVALEETIQELKISDAVIVLSGHTLNEDSQLTLKKLVFEKWDLEQLNGQYHKLINDYQFLETIELNLKASAKINDGHFVLLRLLLIHEYRRILLQDHELPRELLPPNWHGLTAQKMVQQCYQTLASRSIRFIVSQLQNQDGYLPKNSAEFEQRFS
ncbi:PaaX family transcriptional regulator [Aliikangiella sp. IMCC44632]